MRNNILQAIGDLETVFEESNLLLEQLEPNRLDPNANKLRGNLKKMRDMCANNMREFYKYANRAC